MFDQRFDSISDYEIISSFILNIELSLSLLETDREAGLADIVKEVHGLSITLGFT
jgi:hypothetical protein